MKTVLQVRHLHKSFKKALFSKEQKILQSLSFSLIRGEVTGFLGANGSGKTTALKCILGLMSYDEGEMCFFDKGPLSRAMLKRVGFLPEEPCFYNYLTAEELLIFYGRLASSLKISDLKSRVRKWLKNLGIEGAKDQKIKTFSKGMLRKVGLAQAFMLDPELLILDEPLAGLDPDSREQAGQLIENYAKQGGTVFFSSHLLYDVGKICDKLVVLREGKALYAGFASVLLDQAQYEIVYRKKDKKDKVVLNNLKDCQNQLDRLRKDSCVILAVQQLNQTLESIGEGQKKKEEQEALC